MADKFDEILDEYLSCDKNIDVEESVMFNIKTRIPSKHNHIKRVLLIVALLVITMSIGFATSRFIFNDDGSVTMFNEAENKQWKIQPSNSGEDIKGKQWIALKTLIDFLDEYPLKEHEIILGYLNYSEETEDVIFIRDEDNFDQLNTFLDHESLDPIYKNIMALIPEEYQYFNSKIRYELAVEDFDYYGFLEEAESKAEKGEVYYKILPKPNAVGFVEIRYDTEMINKRMGRFTFILANEQYIFSSGSNDEAYNSKSFETIAINDLEFLVERLENSYINVSTVYNDKLLMIRTDLVVMSLDEIVDLMVNISYLMK